MNRNRTLIFLVGVILGAGSMVGYNLAREHRRESRTEQFWKYNTEWGLRPYYRPSVKVPLPKSLDLSTNPWRQLVFWESYVSLITLAGTNSFGPPGHLVSLGYRKEDPDWFNYVDKVGGTQLAWEVSALRASGFTDDQLVEWLTTNTSATAQYNCTNDYYEAFRQINSKGR